MLLAHISDTHFRSRGEKLYGFIDVNAANADVVSQLNALRERPDAVVVSGDIVNCGRPEEYQVARQILGSLNYPLYLIPATTTTKPIFSSIFIRCARSWATIRKICAMRWMTSPPACCLSTPVMPARQKAG